MKKTSVRALKDELGQEDAIVLKHSGHCLFDRWVVTGPGSENTVEVKSVVGRFSVRLDVRSYQDVTDAAVVFLSSKDLWISCPIRRHAGNRPVLRLRFPVGSLQAGPRDPKSQSSPASPSSRPIVPTSGSTLHTLPSCFPFSSSLPLLASLVPL